METKKTQKSITDIKKEKKKPTKAHKKKEKSVKDLAEQIKKSRTLMVVDIKGLPSKQFQEIKKIIREHVLIKVAKKNILVRVIKKLGKESALALEKEIRENCAFAISDLEGFDLAGILAKNKTPIFAKTGQTASENIEVKAGLTNLLPGPAISELSSLGIQIAIEEGKISIKSSKVVVKKGEKINESAVSLFQKLDIKPFDIGLEPIAFYDFQTEKIYSDVKVDAEETVKNLRDASMKALGLAQKIVYYCKETIGYLLGKANSRAGALKKFEPKEEAKPIEQTDNFQKQDGEQEKPKKESTEALKEESEKPITDTKKEEVKEKKPVEEAPKKELTTETLSEKPITNNKEIKSKNETEIKSEEGKLEK